MTTAAEIREKFLSYFESKGHTRVPSGSLVLKDDPTLLFANAGMVQFKNVFTGADQRPYSRATSCQKCLRISGKHNDFENVGVTARHHTFFEMLGNFSFGDYFKKDAIEYAWEFITKELGFDKQRLWVTIYKEDNEAAKLWTEHTDIDPNRIVRLGEEDNFWAMGDTGPCGPCSELHYYIGDDVNAQSAQALEHDGATYVEIYNLVFMQYERAADGSLEPLPKPSIDTGLGFERVVAIAQGGRSNYDGDLLRGIIALCEELSGFQYDGSSFKERNLKQDLEYARDVAMRVIADHSRAVSFLIADGVHPSSDGPGYVLRRILRRAIRHGRVLEFSEPFFAKTCGKVIELMGESYPELQEHKDLIIKVVHAEETKFHETLDAGLTILQREVAKVKQGERFSGEAAFLLHDTYGFPLDLTQDALKAYSLEVDEEGFQRAMNQQRTRSREERKAQGIQFQSVSVSGDATKFLGYEHTQTSSSITHIAFSDKKTKKATLGQNLSLFCKETPFYAESGGQVGDTGIIALKDCKLEVQDTQKIGKQHIQHICKVVEGECPASVVGQSVELLVDVERRKQIRLNHSATHLLHSGLRKFLGDHIKQAGSRVDDRSLRFDYSHFENVSYEQLAEIQEFVNEQIRANHEVTTRLMDLEEAKATGAMALFGEKYDEKVRVVQIGPDSLELCGGTHVQRSGDIGMLLLASDGGISAGVRRIECWTGPRAFQHVLAERSHMSRIAQQLKGDTHSIPERVEKLLERVKVLEKEVEQAKSKLASAASTDLLDCKRTSPGGIDVIAERIENTDSDTLRTMVDRLRLKIGSGVVVLGSSHGKKAVIVAGATSDLGKKIHVGNIVKEAVANSGGKGGGRPDFAQAGGVDSSKLGDTLDKVFELIS